MLHMLWCEIWQHECRAGKLIWLWPLLISIALFVVAVVLIVVFDRGSRRVTQSSRNI